VSGEDIETIECLILAKVRSWVTTTIAQKKRRESRKKGTLPRGQRLIQNLGKVFAVVGLVQVAKGLRKVTGVLPRVAGNQVLGNRARKTP